MSKALSLAFDFDRLEHLVLLILQDAFAKSDEEFVHLSAIRERLPGLSANPIREAIRGLKASELVVARTEMRPAGPLGLIGGQEKEVELTQYRITRRGLRSASGLDEDYRNELWDELARDAATPSQHSNEEDRWEPLEIDRSTPEFKEMVARTNEAIERIEADNGYAANEPQEREGVLAALKSAMKATTEGVLSRPIVHSLLLKPLRYIAEKFAGTGIGEVAKKAFEAAWKYFSAF